VLAICAATTEDAAEILALQLLAYESEARLYNNWTIPPLTQSLESLRLQIENETVLKAMEGTAIIGSVRGALGQGVCRIGRLMVHPRHQGRGIGTQLLHALERIFPAAAQFELFTGSRSEGNIRLYLKSGYVVTGTRPGPDEVTLIVLSKRNAVPDNTAVRTALWRALHVQIDDRPHVFEDEIGLALAAPQPGWQQRPDMDPNFTRRFRASIVARARFVEDLLAAEVNRGIKQYIILGAGLDTFAQRQPKLAATLQVYEIDQPSTQRWKRQRLSELGYGIAEWLRFVPVDFEAGAHWWEQLALAGFDARRPAFLASTGVCMYLSREANAVSLRQIAALAPGSTLAMTFQLPLEALDPEDREGRLMAEKGARAAGTPFISFFSPQEMLELARECGFKTARHVAARSLAERYLAGRADGLWYSSGEEFLVATT
jgi:methyltransferase (TIGR00027 family)